MNSFERFLYVNLTFNCNQRCVFCVSDRTVECRKKSGCQFLSIDTFSHEIEKIPSDINIIHISGGEPTLHPELEEVLRIAGKRFSKVQMATNGVTLSNACYLEKLVRNAKIQFVIPLFTLDANTHQNLVGVDTLSLIVRGLQNVSCLAKEGKCNLSLKLIFLSPTFSQQCSLIQTLPAMGIEPTDYIVSGLCRTDGAIRNNCVIPFNASRSELSKIARTIVATGKPFCFHRLPLCAFESDIWPYLMTLDKDDKRIEYATAITINPDGTKTDIPPRHLVEMVCRDCDLVDWCEFASSRNQDEFDYAQEFCPIKLETTEYAHGYGN